MNLNLDIAPAAGGSHDVWRDVNRLSRGEVEAALNWGGYATYDHESTDALRACLVQCIADGEISLDCVVLS